MVRILLLVLHVLLSWIAWLLKLIETIAKWSVDQIMKVVNLPDAVLWNWRMAVWLAITAALIWGLWAFIYHLRAAAMVLWDTASWVVTIIIVAVAGLAVFGAWAWLTLIAVKFG